jgi:hypothetical protein
VNRALIQSEWSLSSCSSYCGEMLRLQVGLVRAVASVSSVQELRGLVTQIAGWVSQSCDKLQFSVRAQRISYRFTCGLVLSLHGA